MLTRQLNGPDLDCLVSKTTFLLRFQVLHHHLPLLGSRGDDGVLAERHLGRECDHLVREVEEVKEDILETLDQGVNAMM